MIAETTLRIVNQSIIINTGLTCQVPAFEAEDQAEASKGIIESLSSPTTRLKSYHLFWSPRWDKRGAGEVLQ